MANKVTLKDSTTDEIIYPQTLVDSVQDESGATLKTLVLMKNNTDAFTPTGNYQPTTKKYVDDVIATTKSTIVSAALSANNWSGDSAPYTYTLSISDVTTTSNQELLPALNITEEQLTALQSANIQDGGQSSGSVTLKAFGDKPTIDLPIRVIVRGDM